jgi:hypothetical protein
MNNGASGNMLFPPSEKCIPVHGPADGVDDLLSLENHDGRNTGYVEPPRQMGILLGIDLDDRSPAGQLPRYLLHHRCKVDAVRSPGSPEFRQDRPSVALHETVEASVRQSYRLRMERGKRGVATAAFPCYPFARRRDPIGRAAGGAGDQICNVVPFHRLSLSSIAKRYGSWHKA